MPRVLNSFVNAIKERISLTKEQLLGILALLLGSIVIGVAIPRFVLPAAREYSQAKTTKKVALDLKQNLKSASQTLTRLQETRTSEIKGNLETHKNPSWQSILIAKAFADNEFQNSTLNPYLGQGQETVALSQELLTQINQIRQVTVDLQEQLSHPNRYLDDQLYLEAVEQVKESEENISAILELAGFYSVYGESQAVFAASLARLEITLQQSQPSQDYYDEAVKELNKANEILATIGDTNAYPEELQKLSQNTLRTYSNFQSALKRLSILSASNPQTAQAYYSREIVEQVVLSYDQWRDIESIIFQDEGTIAKFHQKAEQIISTVGRTESLTPVEVVIKSFNKEEAIDVGPILIPVSEPTPTLAPSPTPTPILLNDMGISIGNLEKNVTLSPGESRRALTITSTGANGISMYGYPTSYGPGINWSISSTGLVTGKSIDINIKVNSNIPEGSYTGNVEIISYPTNTRQKIGEVTVKVEKKIEPTAAPTSTQPSSTPVPGTAATPTPTPSPAQSGANVNTSSVSITLNRGETKQNVFSFTSTGATQFSLYGYPTGYGPGINASPSSGGMVVGSTMNISLQVNSNVPAGTYSGNQKLIFNPGNVEKNVQFTVTVIEPPAASIGFTFSADSVNLSIKRGTSATVFTFTSTGSTSFSFPGYPTSYGPGINWWSSSGGSTAGTAYEQKIQVNSNVPVGSYSGTGLFRDGTSGAEKSIPITVTITD